MGGALMAWSMNTFEMTVLAAVPTRRASKNLYLKEEKEENKHEYVHHSICVVGLPDDTVNYFSLYFSLHCPLQI